MRVAALVMQHIPHPAKNKMPGGKQTGYQGNVMEREFSAGGVVVRPMRGRWWLAAIEPQGRSQHGKQPVLALPKGLVDSGETPEQTAVREVHEETGVSARVMCKLGDIKYVFTRTYGGGERVFKIVSFYLLRYQSGKLGEISSDMRIEVRRVVWLPLDEAPRRLSCKGEREMAEKALNYLHSTAKARGN